MHVTANSKEVKVGSIFFALKGAKFDGHDFINSAIEAGASKIFCEREVPHLPLPKGTTLEVIGNDARKKLGEFASAMFERPTHTLKMIGVTGTSGKTTTTY